MSTLQLEDFETDRRRLRLTLLQRLNWRKAQCISLTKAVLCVNCDCITNSPGQRCLACDSVGALLNLAKVLERKSA